jgi:hypothetical protein
MSAQKLRVVYSYCYKNIWTGANPGTYLDPLHLNIYTDRGQSQLKWVSTYANRNDSTRRTIYNVSYVLPRKLYIHYFLLLEEIISKFEG